MHGCISGLILHGAFQTKFLGILYHKLSTFMLIRRGAGSFRCHFQIFEILENFIQRWMAPYYGIMVRHSPQFLCYQLELEAHVFMRDRSYQWLKDATSFGLISDKSDTRYEVQNIGKIANSPYWPHGASPLCLLVCK